MCALGLSVLMASSQSLHKALHQDASSPAHHCVATLLSRQQILPADGAPVAFEAALGFFIEPAREVTASLSSIGYLPSRSRAPPVLS